MSRKLNETIRVTRICADVHCRSVEEARKNTATNNNKRANKNSSTTPAHGFRKKKNSQIIFYTLSFHYFPQTCSQALQSSAFFVWLAECKQWSANHTTPALQASEVTPQWTITRHAMDRMQPSNKVWKDRDVIYPANETRSGCNTAVTDYSMTPHNSGPQLKQMVRTFIIGKLTKMKTNFKLQPTLWMCSFVLAGKCIYLYSQWYNKIIYNVHMVRRRVKSEAQTVTRGEDGEEQV